MIKYMKRKALFDLKQSLYFTFGLLKNSELDIDINSVQFFDEIPSAIVWDLYVSANEHHVIHFKNDLLIKSRKLNGESFDTNYMNLAKLVNTNKTFHLFSSRNESIFFALSELKNILNALRFFEEEDCLLYSFDTQTIITGGWDGYTVWTRR